MLDSTHNVAKSRTQIALVENHAILREGLKALIEIDPDLEVVGDFGSVEESLEGLRKLQPSLVVMDLEFPGRSGFELLSEIGKCCPATRKLVLTGLDDEEHVRAALNAGADGYVLKDANAAELLRAIHTVTAGLRFLSREIAGKHYFGYLSGGRSRKQSLEAPPITGREREVLTRIALGASNKVIARTLGLSVKTVEKHRSNLMRKLRLHNTAEITMYAVRHGLTGTRDWSAVYDGSLRT